MRLRRTPAGTDRRRGMILLIVLTMLVLFAIAGVTFVLYANATSESARFARDAESFASAGGPDMDPTASFNLFLGQLLYGTKNDATGAQSSLRGHSLAETMYGSYDALGNAPYVPSDVPFDGTGRLHAGQAAIAGSPDEYNLVNYMYFQAAGFAHDPSRYGSRANPGAAFGPNDLFTGGQNAPYTYPDLNSMYLAYINQATGQVVVPSYHRHWLFNNGMALNDLTNPFWTNAEGKYRILRPRPQDMGAGFPYPTDATGDVKNLLGMPGGNDSIWIDIGAPELSTASGLKYKMLVAPLVLDLDNRVNLNVVGNVFAQGGLHAGNQHWGQWEVNISRVLMGNAPAPQPNEWQNLFLGNAGNNITGRYGAGKLPSPSFPLSGPVPHLIARADLNGVIDPGSPGAFTATPAWSLPGGANTVPYQSFPYWPPQGYHDGGTLETQEPVGTDAHPMFFNPMVQASNGPNRLLPVDSHGKLLWAGVFASPTSDLVRLCPNNFKAGGANTGRYINESTVLSMDLDRAGAAPYVWDPNAPQYTISYNYNPQNGPVGYTYTPTTGQAFPALTQRLTPPPANSEFDPNTWRSVLPGALSRLDLDKQLAPYPASGVQPADRQQFATDIYTRFLAATGMTAANANVATATPQQYASLRWLAQLSANIVDYIDTDDVMTAFQWTKTPQAGDTGWVFGTELPKVVLNEVYLQYNNDPTDPGMGNKATKPYQMNVWVELLNPLPSGNNTDGSNNNAVLQNTVNGQPNPVYQVVLTKQNGNVRNAANVVGDPDGTPPPFTAQPYSPTGVYNSTPGTPQVLSAVNTVTNNGTGNQLSITPVGQAYSGPSQGNAGFYVLGPADTTPTSNLPCTLTTPQYSAANKGTVMTYTVPLGDANAENPNAAGVQPTVMLQRLANPNLPYQPVATSPNYNPYVTVDYVDMTTFPGGTVNDARTYTANAKVTPPDPSTRYSYGRQQPYGGNTLVRQQPNPSNPMGTPQTTFYYENADSSTPNPNNATVGGFTPPPNYPPFDWLVHLDRPIISPAELLFVSAFKPHELTQQFSKNTTTYPGMFNHYAPWFDQNSRLYRMLEFVKMKNPTPGIVNGGRIPGKININTIDVNAPEVFQALCDAEPGNNFDSNMVTQVFNQLMAQRTPNGTPGPTGVGGTDQPFWGMAMGYDPSTTQYPPNAGILQTLLAPSANPQSTNQRLFAPNNLFQAPIPQPPHAYQQMELLDKLFNNVTTRSNVYAVWLTVGFFQVLDDTTTPMKLGPEVNQAQGTNIRHHMFAIVDRTQIVTFGSLDTTSASAVHTGAAITAGTTASIGIPTSVTDSRTGNTWQLQDGTTPAVSPLPASTLVYDPGLPNEETVVIQAGFTATFTQSHAAGANVVSRGHPGPWKQYDASQDSQVVPYFVIID